MTKKISLFASTLAAAGLVFASGACGNNNNNNSTPDGGKDAGSQCPTGSGPATPVNACHDACDKIVTLAGQVDLDPVGKKLPGHPTITDWSTFKIHVLDPLKVLGGVTKCQHLGDQSGTDGNGNAGQALATDGKFSDANIDADKVTLGIIGNIVGPGAVVTGTGLHGPFTNITSGSTQNAAPAFVVDDNMEGILSQQMGKTPGYLKGVGFVLIHVVDTAGLPVGGVQVAVSAGSPTIICPKADFTGPTADGKTADGLGLCFIPALNASGTPPTISGTKTGLTFGTAQAASQPNTAYIAFLQQQ